MAGAIDLNCPLIFDPKGDSTNLGSRWKKLKKGFELYIIASGIENGAQKRALILHCAGEDIQEIVETFNDPVDTYERLVQALDNYFLPKQDKRYERHIFRQFKRFAETQNKNCEYFYKNCTTVLLRLNAGGVY